MNLDEKRIFFIMSPHINYYHSYRGDSIGNAGFGKDVELMEGILNQLDILEDEGFCNGTLRMTWDYADTFWSIQLQKEYQHSVLDKVIERCKRGKDEVMLGSWANIGQAYLDSEELKKDQEWLLENSMGIGLNQLFRGRVAPYCRPQEVMYTQGMIELYNKIGIKGICLYYSAVPFDAGRPFLNPRLNLNQRYGLVKLNSTVSDESIIMIPTYSFGDIYDFLSIKKWFELIRSQQISGEISGHALVFMNFDMDYDNWVGIKMPKKLEWMPNTRGMRELAEAVDAHDYIEFANLIDIIPKLPIYGETKLYPDVADGIFNGFYNWAQKYNNTRFWTIGQRARWMKCISDTLIENGLVKENTQAINQYIREGDDSAQTYLKNKLLFCSTTNFGLSMPFLHPDRRKTTMVYGLNAHRAAERAINLAVKESVENILRVNRNDEFNMFMIPVIKRGITEAEKTSIDSSILLKFEIPKRLSDNLIKKDKNLRLECDVSEFRYSIYNNDSDSKHVIEAILPEISFKQKNVLNINMKIADSIMKPEFKENSLRATINELKNEYICIDFDDKGEIVSFKFDNKDFGCHNFLESAVTFGKPKKGKRYSSKQNQISVIRDGTDGFSSSVKILSEFEIEKNSKTYAEKILTLYSGIPHLFVNANIKFPNIKGKTKTVGIVSAVATEYDIRWREVMPCEIKPAIIGNGTPLRIWKKNFFGYVSYFDLDMRDVDNKNADIDCLVSNISDGWMAISNRKMGLLIGFNALKAANFAFSPIKIRDRGFGDVNMRGQQIRINPFGNYYGNSLHYWTDGTGHAQKLTGSQFTNFRSAASSFSGNTLSFDLLISPYFGDAPPKEIQSFANHFSLPPLTIISKKGTDETYDNFSIYHKLCENLIDELGIRDIMDMPYLDWVKKVNESYDGKEEVEDELDISTFGIMNLLRLYFDGRKGR